MKRLYALLLAAVLFFGVYAYAEETKSEIADAVLRLHIVANSDSEKDQAVKMKVRDAVRKELYEAAPDIKNKSDAVNAAKKCSEKLKKAAEDTLKKEGFNYPVTVEIGKADFPTKSYEDITLPKGRYDAVNVKLGKAEGKNWWCVMYPPLCIADSVSAEFLPEAKEELKASVTDSEYKIISGAESNGVKIKFKILEMF